MERKINIVLIVVIGLCILNSALLIRFLNAPNTAPVSSLPPKPVPLEKQTRPIPRQTPIAITAATSCSLPLKVTSPATLRCAVIGGMTQTGFWDALAERFEQATGCHLEVVATGPKSIIAEAFLQGDVDFITMHSSDTMVNLAADGYVENLQPWLKNDLVLVGPPDDPAGIKGLTDPAEAFRIIIENQCNYVVHQSLGAQDVLKGIMKPAGLVFDEQHAFVKLDDRQHDVLKFAAQHHAYTMIGRIPFLSGKMPNDHLIIMVQGHPSMRRPYLSAVASPKRCPGVRYEAALALQYFLQTSQTQSWIADYGRGQLDHNSIFIPIGLAGTLPRPATPDSTEYTCNNK